MRQKSVALDVRIDDALRQRHDAVYDAMKAIKNYWESDRLSDKRKHIIDSHLALRRYDGKKWYHHFPNPRGVKIADYYVESACADLGLVLQEEKPLRNTLPQIMESLKNALGQLRSCLSWHIPGEHLAGLRFVVNPGDVDFWRELDKFILDLKENALLMDSVYCDPCTEYGDNIEMSSTEGDEITKDIEQQAKRQKKGQAQS